MICWLEGALPTVTQVFHYSSAAFSDVGRVRSLNEDSYLNRPDIGLWVVADGMGGHDAGDYASNLIVERLDQLQKPSSARGFLNDVKRLLIEVNDELRNRARSLGEGRVIGSTVVAFLIYGRHYACLWAGDSRIYRLHRGRLQRLTRDHSYVQEMIDSGALSPAEAAKHPQGNVITRAVGAGDELQLDSDYAELMDDDIVMLCSDGLSGAVDDAEIGQLLRENLVDDCPTALVNLALDKGSTDNVTVVVIKVSEDSTLKP
jgi:serine/threonine-protein phosphatase Stp1